MLGSFEFSSQGSPTPGVVDLAAAQGEPVFVLSLDEQEGEAEVAFVGDVHGITIGVVHRVREADGIQRYLLLYGHLDRPGAGVTSGARLRTGDTLGFTGDTGSPGQVHLRLEVRQLREGARLEPPDPRRLLEAAVSFPCDPRNVLPRRGP
ncbi:UL36 very large tegument protein [Chondromyces apiculatus DSM 436]|uniref:UL36 very large tegument protein n=1 Tax=Chondromyces apiculatus DSM 436 TaxID=1192034 RepID=A0A017T0E4_9BACT|nr:UL36 very large tegument protein [Chondromyces apiculatus DSM 436]